MGCAAVSTCWMIFYTPAVTGEPYGHVRECGCTCKQVCWCHSIMVCSCRGSLCESSRPVDKPFAPPEGLRRAAAHTSQLCERLTQTPSPAASLPRRVIPPGPTAMRQDEEKPATGCGWKGGAYGGLHGNIPFHTGFPTPAPRHHQPYLQGRRGNLQQVAN